MTMAEAILLKDGQIAGLYAVLSLLLAMQSTTAQQELDDWMETFLTYPEQAMRFNEETTNKERQLMQEGFREIVINLRDMLRDQRPARENS